MEPILTCGSCGSKLKPKPAAVRVLKEVACSKCRHPVLIPPEVKAAVLAAAADAQSGAQGTPGEAAPVTGAAGAAAPASSVPTVAGAGTDGGRLARLADEVARLQSELARQSETLARIRRDLADLSKPSA
jgi:DNA-directed RNA polymerase subunit RPC12/RpoP